MASVNPEISEQGLKPGQLSLRCVRWRDPLTDGSPGAFPEHCAVPQDSDAEGCTGPPSTHRSPVWPRSPQHEAWMASCRPRTAWGRVRMAVLTLALAGCMEAKGGGAASAITDPAPPACGVAAAAVASDHSVENIDLEGISTQAGPKGLPEQVVSEMALPSTAVIVTWLSRRSVLTAGPCY